jgi:hypothetical protein
MAIGIALEWKGASLGVQETQDAMEEAEERPEEAALAPPLPQEWGMAQTRHQNWEKMKMDDSEAQQGL